MVYQDMSTKGFYTTSTVRKNQLLRPYPQMTGLNRTNARKARCGPHALEVSFERRFSRGYNFYAGYTGCADRRRGHLPRRVRPDAHLAGEQQRTAASHRRHGHLRSCRSARAAR